MSTMGELLIAVTNKNSLSTVSSITTKVIEFIHPSSFESISISRNVATPVDIRTHEADERIRQPALNTITDLLKQYTHNTTYIEIIISTSEISKQLFSESTSLISDATRDDFALSQCIIRLGQHKLDIDNVIIVPNSLTDVMYFSVAFWGYGVPTDPVDYFHVVSRLPSIQNVIDNIVVILGDIHLYCWWDV